MRACNPIVVIDTLMRVVSVPPRVHRRRRNTMTTSSSLIFASHRVATPDGSRAKGVSFPRAGGGLDDQSKTPR